MYKFLLCSRYLRTRYIALASIISVMLGVATMIVVNSVMAGFGTQMRDRIHGILADIVIETNSLDGAADYKLHMDKINAAAGDYIAAMSPTVEVYGMLSFQYVGQWITRPVTLIGIDPASKDKVGTVKQNLENFKAEYDRSGKVVRPALRPANEAPDWELLPQYARMRALRIEQQKLLGEDVGDEDEAIDAAAPAALAQPQDAPRDPFADDPIAPANETPADPTRPLDARLYVGASLIQFQYEDKTNGEIKTVSMVQAGDDVKISTVNSGRPPAAVHFDATVVDVFKSGMSEYDSNLVFCNLEYLQKARGMIDPVSGMRRITTIQIKLKDYADAKTVVERLRAAFPPGTYSIRTWEQKQGPLLAAVSVESAILNVLLFLIIAVAGFGILAIFFMIVVEKTRDIGILKALGASSGGVLTIFVSYGLGLGIVGSGVGVVLGLLFVWNINAIENCLTWLTGIEVFDERIYYFPEIPTDIQPMMVFWVAFGAMAIAVLASILPARRASRLHPVQALRYE